MIKSVSDIIAEAQAEINCVDAGAAKSLYDNASSVIILDVRECTSADESKLSESVNIPRGLVEMKFPKVCQDPNTLILTHCAGGGRASLTALTLQQMGYTNVHAITAKYEDIKSVFG